MKRRPVFASIAVFCSLFSQTYAREPIDPKPQSTVQIALLLDTSNSMDGLINQARTQLWKIVNEFNRTRMNGRMPRVQVALYEYGNNNLAAGEGYVRMVLPLTTDLDLVSEKLWALKTNGGSEYCGKVILNAVSELAWGNDKETYRAIFIAGNEPFTQGDVDFKVSCGAALGKSILVNTIHCGTENVGREGQWALAAKLGEGKFLNIDQDRACVVIQTPHDEALAKLSADLNNTYVPYGANGSIGKDRQRMQDQNAQQAGAGAGVERASVKSSGNYMNGEWDLVDALRDKRADLAKMKDSELPDAMKEMSLEQRTAYIKTQSDARAEIQKQIAELQAKREAFIQQEQKNNGTKETDTLDTAVLKAVREQMESKGFKVE